MRITTRTRYGMRALVEMSRKYDEGTVSIRDIAACENLPAKYLEQIFITLKSSGLVKSSRGSRGGYRLCSPPDKIKIIEVFSALEGQTPLVECLADDDCDLYASCSVRTLWKDIDNAITDVLTSKTLADFV